ncbi:DMT family transporter [Desulforhopalus singaporensis]|uniref:EamA domain-containing membrane protein RarD n=1 Tax=Desulforhopalus singaporensis TaxID=91360 RepID=A0A1H0SS68_9BACT|nr:DMT family transporter [Desulforhopalus singaporensis]SDP44066.1 EamA domain-containing membrane protein RarD [Desulforhopalus singaporensis]
MRSDTPRNRVRGIVLTVVAASCFGLIPFFAKLAYSGGFNPFSFSLFRALGTAVTLLVILKVKKISLKVEKSHIPELFKASFFGYFLMMVSLFASYRYIDTGLATTLHFIYPAATIVGAVLFYKDRATLLQIAAVTLVLPGIYLIAGTNCSGQAALYGIILALVSGLFYAYYILVVAHGTINNINSLLIIFYICLFNSITLLITTVITGNLSLDVSFAGLVSSTMMVLVSSVFGMVAFQEGLKAISAAAAAVLSTFEVITSLAIGVIVLGESLGNLQLIGCLLVVVSVIFVALPEKESHTQLDAIKDN